MSLSLSININIYIYMYIHRYICILIHIDLYTHIVSLFQVSSLFLLLWAKDSNSSTHISSVVVHM